MAARISIDELVAADGAGPVSFPDGIDVAWSKVANHPTTLAGYGIADAVPASQTQAAENQALRVLTVQPKLAGSAPFIIELDSIGYNGHPDPLLSIGYNLSADGSALLASEPALGWKIEANYDDGSADRKMEIYTQYNDGLGNGYRPYFLQIDRTTNTSIMQVVATSFSYFLPNPADATQNRQIAVFTDSTLTMMPQTIGNSTIDIQAGSGSRKGRLKLGYDGVSGVVTLEPGVSNNYAIFTVNTQTFSFAAISSGIAGPALGIGIAIPVTPLHVKPASSNLSIVTVDQITSGLGNMIQLRDNAGTTTYHRFNKLGYSMTRKTAAPPDADVVASEATCWFDDTNGAGKWMIKGKTANGTVVTGSVTLA